MFDGGTGVFCVFLPTNTLVVCAQPELADKVEEFCASAFVTVSNAGESKQTEILVEVSGKRIVTAPRALLPVRRESRFHSRDFDSLYMPRQCHAAQLPVARVFLRGISLAVIVGGLARRARWNRCRTRRACCACWRGRSTASTSTSSGRISIQMMRARAQPMQEIWPSL